jgi:sugar transferase (PEP-CTERM/EpsH1 system associated)
MRILWVKAGGIVPADTGGRIRSLHILKELARRHSVTVFTYYAEHFNDQHRHRGGESGELRSFADVVAIPIALQPERTFRDHLQFGRMLFSSDPCSMQVIGGESGGRLRYFDGADIRRRLDALIAGGNFDILVCDFIYPAGLIDWTLSCPKILFTHNVEAQLWKQQFEAARHPLKKLLYWKEWRALRAAEIRYARQADYVIAVSEQNRAFFSRYVSPARVSTIATGVDIDFFRPAAAEASPSMVFTGSMDWMPNQQGVLFFTAEILPHIHAEVPNADLWIVGRYPSSEIQRLSSAQIHVTGRVDDIRPYLEKAPVYIVPLLSGSGTRIKIFEAMAMGKAVVSTSLGAEGLPVTHGQNILIADHPREFAGAVVRVLRDPELAARLGRAARALVEKQCTWKTAAIQFESILQDAVRGNRQPATVRKTA